jgi:hypothetical protein
VVATNNKKLVAGALLLMLGVGSLSGCATAVAGNIPEGNYPDLSLADSKTPAQLLRNTAVGRIPEDVVLNVGTDLDGSIACLTEEEDPDGLIRQWSSSIDVNIKQSQAINTEQIVKDVVATFTDAGWMGQATSGSTSDGHATLLTNGTATADGVDSVRVRIEPVISGDKATAFIHVEATGPCVVTGGASSKEVIDLGKI